jgi:hypothetical protein
LVGVYKGVIMKYIASCSFGKDSLATIIVALKNKEPLNEAIYCEVMFDKNVSGEVPEHRDFIYNKAIPKLKEWGVKTTVLQSDVTYKDYFYRVIKSGARVGKIRGFPVCGMCGVNRDCKKPPIKKYLKSIDEEITQYVGIANDEDTRLMRLEKNSMGKRIKQVSLLEKYGITQKETREICKAEGLLSPSYEFVTRGGCFFCFNAKDKELRHLYDNHPQLWNEMLELQKAENKASELFTRDMRFIDIHNNFMFDDSQMRAEDYL